MLERLKTAIPLIVLIALAFMLPGAAAPSIFLLIAIAMIAAACHEMFAMSAIEHRKTFQICTTLFAVLLVLSSALPHRYSPLCATALPLLLITASSIAVFRFGPTKESVTSFLVSLGIAFYAVWPLIFIVKLYFINGFVSKDSRLLPVFMIAVTKMADVGAYFIGSATSKLPGGNHKLAPRLSPKKSWEGLIGGTVFSAAAAAGFSCIPAMVSLKGISIISMPEAIIFGILASVLGLLGDLIESAVKRAAQVKDSGNIPGIGGIMDVLDSLIPAAPLFYLFVLLKTL